MNFFKAFGKRLVLSTPSFFMKIVYFGISLGAIGLGIQELGATMNLPAWLIDQADNMMIVGAVAAVIAKATVKNPEAIK